MRNRNLIIGSPGAGKSTFARGLRDRTGLPLFYLDQLYHRPDGTAAPREVFDEALSRLLALDRFIIDGNYPRTLPLRLERCDRVFFFDLPVDQCLDGASRRIGRPREDMPWVEAALDPGFRQCIIDFPQRQRPAILELLERYTARAEIVTFHTREEADAWLANEVIP